MQKILERIFSIIRKNNDLPPPVVDSAEVDVEIMMNHPLMHELHQSNIASITYLNISDPLKLRMCQAIISVVYSEIERVVTTIIKDYHRYAINDHDLLDLYMESNERIHQGFISAGVPELFLNNFHKRSSVSVHILITTISDLQQKRKFASDVDKIMSILDITLLCLRFTMETLGGILNSMNGELHRLLEGSAFDTDF